eukprot:10971338-Alexandrium_andersonii.AAC.1
MSDCDQEGVGLAVALCVGQAVASAAEVALDSLSGTQRVAPVWPESTCYHQQAACSECSTQSLSFWGCALPSERC